MHNYDTLTLACKIYTSALIISTFLTTIYTYYYGYVTSQYCFHADINIANMYHSVLHFISFFGHLCITIL